MGVGVLIIYGINPVLEALRAGRVRVLRISDRGGDRLRELTELASTRGVTVQRTPVESLVRQARGGVHQGVVAEVDTIAAHTVEDLVRSGRGASLIVVLDGVEDPHNLGAIVRTSDAAGVDGIVVQSRRSAALDGIAAKASSGALAHVRMARVVNIARAVEELKQANIWTVGFAGDANESYDAIDFTLPTALVFGGEGGGLRRLVRERCDRLVSIPMRGHVGSLNVSVAAGVALFEADRQRRKASGA